MLRNQKIASLSGFWPLYSSQAQIACAPALGGVSYSVQEICGLKEGKVGSGVCNCFRFGIVVDFRKKKGLGQESVSVIFTGA